eukprot:m.132294 g.132294  ORF g.132294 m.132294 type:complete len:1110 (-) comp22439_c0_seq4:108-3437(-)
MDSPPVLRSSSSSESGDDGHGQIFSAGVLGPNTGAAARSFTLNDILDDSVSDESSDDGWPELDSGSQCLEHAQRRLEELLSQIGTLPSPPRASRVSDLSRTFSHSLSPDDDYPAGASASARPPHTMMYQDFVTQVQADWPLEEDGAPGYCTGGYSLAFPELSESVDAHPRPDSDGGTVLHLALATITVGDSVICRLLAAEADPNARDALGRTPLDVAIAARRPISTVRLLLENGASVAPDDLKTCGTVCDHDIADATPAEAAHPVGVAVSLGSVVAAHDMLMLMRGRDTPSGADAGTAMCSNRSTDDSDPQIQMAHLLLHSFSTAAPRTAPAKAGISVPGAAVAHDTPHRPQEHGSGALGDVVGGDGIPLQARCAEDCGKRGAMCVTCGRGPESAASITEQSNPLGSEGSTTHVAQPCVFSPGRWTMRLPPGGDLDSGCGDGSEFFYDLRLDSPSTITGFQTDENFDIAAPFCRVEGTVDGETVSWKCTPLVVGLTSVAHCVGDLGDNGASIIGKFDIRDPDSNSLLVEGIFTGEVTHDDTGDPSTSSTAAEQTSTDDSTDTIAMVTTSSTDVEPQQLRVAKGEVLTILDEGATWVTARNSIGHEGRVSMDAIDFLPSALPSLDSPLCSRPQLAHFFGLHQVEETDATAGGDSTKGLHSLVSHIREQMWVIPDVALPAGSAISAGSQLDQATRALGVAVRVPSCYHELVTPVIEMTAACILHATRQSKTRRQLRSHLVLLRVDANTEEGDLPEPGIFEWDAICGIVRGNVSQVLRAAVSPSNPAVPKIESVSSESVQPGVPLTKLLHRLTLNCDRRDVTVIVAQCRPCHLADTIERVAPIDRAFCGVADRRLLERIPPSIAAPQTTTARMASPKVALSTHMNRLGRLGLQARYVLHGAREEVSNWGMCVLDMSAFGDLWKGSPAMVEHVAAGSSAHAMGLRRGDEVIHVNDTPVTSQDAMVIIVSASIELKMQIIRHSPTMLDSLTEKLEKQKLDVRQVVTTHLARDAAQADRVARRRALHDRRAERILLHQRMSPLDHPIDPAAIRNADVVPRSDGLLGDVQRRLQARNVALESLRNRARLVNERVELLQQRRRRSLSRPTSTENPSL